MRRIAILLMPLACCFGSPALQATPPQPPTREAIEFFEKTIRPILVEKCQKCHGPTKQRGGLRLDSRARLLKGGDSGAVVVPGQPDKSPLLLAVRHAGEPKILNMPPKEKLPARTVASLAAWIKIGAPWPDGGAGPSISAVAEARKRHWAFRPVVRPALPAPRGAPLARTPLDRFILARLESKGLTLSAEANARTLIRRATFDLLGLPPTPEEVAEFIADKRPGAYERLIDRLLASPAYGERWGRHWLDVARYADSKGYVFTEERRYPYSYTYRDYVIKALNDDLPYDRFILHQLAADRLPLGEDSRPLAAMGFLTLGRRFLNNPHDIIDDRIDVVTRGLLGLTVTCARCHDHKFDPVPTRDYYSLYGVFASSFEPKELPLIGGPSPSAAAASFEKELRARQAKAHDFLVAEHAKLLPELRARTGEYILATRDRPRRRGGAKRGEQRPALVARWRTYLRETEKRHHPVFAPWQAFAALPADEFKDRASSLAERFAANKEPGKRINPAVAAAFAGQAPASLAEVARRYGDLFAGVERAWQEGLRREPGLSRLPNADQEELRQVLHGPGSPTSISAAEIERYFNRAQRDRLTALRKRIDQWKVVGGGPPRAMVLNDGSPHNPRVFVRGNPNNPGVPVPRQFLEVLAGEGRKPFGKGSGRLELARAIASPDNPLTARVLVNRVWMHHFGQGLVRTPGDFGTRGDPPTHPELLDYLAASFVENGWSIKKLHRLIMLSAVYRQSSDDNPKAESVDPENTLWWRINRRRLELEPLRDALLKTAGRLDAQLGGPAVDITKGPFSTRRSVYGFIDRQNLPGLFRTFDFASPDTSTAQRYSTTVPQQALFLMNGPFVVEQARAFAARPDVLAQRSDEGRIQRMHWLAYGRAADADEVELGLRFLRAGGPAPKEGGPKLSAWEQYAQVLLLANEFAFVD